MPADHGLTGLGLFMQLAGSVFLVFGGFLTIFPLMQGGASGPGGPGMEIFFIGVASILRSVFHRSAGAALLYGSPKGPLHPMKVYIGVALTQSVGVAILISHMGAPMKLVLYLFCVLAAWPITLAILTRTRRFKSIGRDLAKAEDMGFESAAVLMTIFGLMGSIWTGLLLLTLFTVDLVNLREVPSLLWVGLLLLLLLRSILHARAGLQGIKGVNTDRTSESAATYFNYGVMISVIAGAMLMLQMAMTSARMNIVLFLFVAMATFLLLAWPLALRTFFTERNFAMLLDEDTITRRAPDTGLTALGWMLVGLGVLNLAMSLGSEIFLGGSDAAAGAVPLFEQFNLGEFEYSPWWSIGIAGMQLAAGLELIFMSDRHRIVATAYGAVAMAITLYLWWPVLKSLSGDNRFAMLANMRFSNLASMGVYTQLLLGLTIPAMTVFLVNRDTAPEARARIRE